MKIKLDPSEMMFAVMGGAMRRIQALQRGRVDKYGTVQYPWQADIEGAMAEMAVAKAFGIFWSGDVGNIYAIDVGSYQVRSTPYESGHLVINKPDKDEHIFILVIGRDGEYDLRGYAMAGDVKREEFWTSKSMGRFAYFVPQEVLRPVRELMEKPNVPQLP